MTFIGSVITAYLIVGVLVLLWLAGSNWPYLGDVHRLNRMNAWQWLYWAAFTVLLWPQSLREMGD